MPGIQSKVQCVLTLDLGRFQDPRAASLRYTCIHTYRARARAHVSVCNTNSHTCRTFGTVTTGTPPGSTLTCSCTGPLVNFWSTLAISPRLSSFPPPHPLTPPTIPISRTTVSPICYPLRKTSDEVEDWLNHPLTFQCLALAPRSLASSLLHLPLSLSLSLSL